VSGAALVSSERREVGELGLLGTGLDPAHVQILHPYVERVMSAAREHPGQERRPRVPDVQGAAGPGANRPFLDALIFCPTLPMKFSTP